MYVCQLEVEEVGSSIFQQIKGEMYVTSVKDEHKYDLVIGSTEKGKLFLYMEMSSFLNTIPSFSVSPHFPSSIIPNRTLSDSLPLKLKK